MSDNSMFGNDSGGVSYVSVVQNKLAIRVEEDQAKTPEGAIKEGYRARKLSKGANEGKTVYEQTFDHVTGNITEVKWQPGDFGTQLQIRLEGGGSNALIQVQGLNDDGNILTSFAGSFGDQCGMIEVGQPLKLGLSKRDGKARGFYIEQNDEYFPALHKNERFKKHISERPSSTKTVALDGSDKWDNSAPSAWQYSEINKFIEKLTEVGVGGSEPVGAGNLDSLPF